MEKCEYMDIWKLHPEDIYWCERPKYFKQKMIDIKFILNICAKRDIYPEPHFDTVRWMLISYLIREKFERYGRPVPRFADKKRLHASGCYELYHTMVEQKDSTVECWLELRKNDAEAQKAKESLGLKHASEGQNGAE